MYLCTLVGAGCIVRASWWNIQYVYPAIEILIGICAHNKRVDHSNNALTVGHIEPKTEIGGQPSRCFSSYT